MLNRTFTILVSLFVTCNLTIEALAYDPRYDSVSSPYALSVAQRVAGVLCNGMCNITLFRNPTTENAYTFILPNGQAKIVYNPAFMQAAEIQFGRDATFGILAHEVGHVIDGRQGVSWMLNSWNRELRADAWSGCAIARANLSESQTISALRVSAQYPSPSHPAWDLRVPAFETGYRECGGSGVLPTLNRSEAITIEELTEEDPLVRDCLKVDMPENGIKWNPNEGTNGVSYNLTLKNTCQCQLKGAFRVISGVIPTENELGENTGWVPFAIKRHKFNLKSGANEKISGILSWSRTAPDVMPKIRYASPPKKDIALVTLDNKPSSGCVSGKYESDYCNAFKEIMKVGAKSIDDLHEKVILSEDDDSKDFKSKINITGMPLGKVVVSKTDTNDVHVSFSESSQDGRDLSNKYDMILESSKQCFSGRDWSIDEKTDKKNGKTLHVSSTTSTGMLGVFVKLSERVSASKTSYRLSVSIYPK